MAAAGRGGGGAVAGDATATTPAAATPASAESAIEGDPELRRRVRVEMYRRLGYFPTESSEHSAEYLPGVEYMRTTQ